MTTLSDRRRYLNARSTLLTLLRLDVIPVINENDTVTTDEIRFGDNDTLGALVTNLIEADVLVLLTDQQGLYTADPRRDPAATLVRSARAGDPELEAMAGGVGTAIGSGGMLTKVLAAKRAARSGASTVIVCGREERILSRLAAGEAIGTALARRHDLACRPQAMARRSSSARRSTDPRCRCRAGAQARRQEPAADRRRSRSPANSTAAKSSAASIPRVARSRAGSSITARRKPRASCASRRRKSSAILGYVDEPELIHRDNMVLLA